MTTSGQSAVGLGIRFILVSWIVAAGDATTAGPADHPRTAVDAGDATTRVEGESVVEMKPIPVSKGVVAPKLVMKTQPKYPEEARFAGLQGRVVLQAIIDEKGQVQDVEVLEGRRNVAASLVASAKDAVRQWRYEPATEDGKPVKVYFTVVVDFSLKKKD